MIIQSLSIVVPGEKCINDCKFCVSKMHSDSYDNRMNINGYDSGYFLNEYIKRLNFARDNGCNTVMLTGQCEPQQNREFLYRFGLYNKLMRNPFTDIEMQTTGRGLRDLSYVNMLRDLVGVNLISFSISSFNESENSEIINSPYIPIRGIIEIFKSHGFIIRLSINLNKSFNKFSIEDILAIAKNEYQADQITFRKLYTSDNATKQNEWILNNLYTKYTDEELSSILYSKGKLLGYLPYGPAKLSIDGMTVVFDADCMAKKEQEKDTYKYLILRPDCHLYSQWDDKGSLIF